GTTLTITEAGTGTANITVTANDGNGGSVSDVFEFNVNAAANNAPVVENPISDMTETEGFVSTTIDISSVFTDADADELTFSTSSDANSVATASLDGTTLTITEAGTGTANISVTANDGNGGSVSDVFDFNVNATANNAPVVENPISDMTETEGFVSATIDISSVFTDADDDELAFSTSSDATNVAIASLDGTTLTITEAGIGTANITVTANDGNGGSASDVFEFVVEDDNSVANLEVSSIYVYPNPAEDYIIIKFEQANRTPVKYELFATSGERVGHGMISNYNDTFQTDVSSYQRGLYFIKISNENIQRVFKISLK
ncbi:MAG: T9SS type A sorting domain-containing protein, partial [Salinivirgaceae bacterium]|nr:T9SS type A sorting domain-containing protein [Salinivirgaceae bacterium]